MDFITWARRTKTASTVATKISAGFLLSHLLVGQLFSSEKPKTEPKPKSENLGVFGKEYSIAERDLLELIHGKLREMEKDGTLDKMNKKVVEDTKKKLNRPPGKVYPRAEKFKSVPYDATFTLQADLKDAKGKVLFPKGTGIDPLKVKAFNRRICFIDGDDEGQVQWLERSCPDSYINRVVLVNGSPGELSKRIKRRFYFDQENVLGKRFGFTALPAVVHQKERSIYVEEIPVD